MATYEYSGYTAGGKLQRGRVESSTEKQAARDLLALGIFVEQVRPVRLDAGLSASRRSSLYRELGALLAAGLPLDRAISLMMESPDPTLSAVLGSVLGAVREGGGLADALAGVCRKMDGYEQAALTSAERAATLPEMLSRLADVLDAQESVRDRVRSALIYPAFVLGFALLIGVMMMGVVVPHTMKMLTASGMELPRTSVWIVTASKIVAGTFILLCGIGMLAMAMIRRFSRKNRAVALRMDAVMLRLPFMKSVASLAGMRFASILSVLTESGMPIVSALPVAGAGTGRPWLVHCVDEATEKVRNGMALSEAVRTLPLIGGELAEWIRVGEAGGCISPMLDAAAARLRRAWERALAHRLALLEPVLLATLGVFILVMSLALILPIASMTRALGLG